jgi:hypothetical protein
MQFDQFPTALVIQVMLLSCQSSCYRKVRSSEFDFSVSIFCRGIINKSCHESKKLYKRPLMDLKMIYNSRMLKPEGDDDVKTFYCKAQRQTMEKGYL